MHQENNSKIAVVTGSNKGIGFAIVKGLVEQNYAGMVYLTSRNVANGNDAVEALQSLGLTVAYHQLDVNDKDSINAFVQHIAHKHGGIDLLVNNAAIKYSSQSTVPLETQIIATLETNYYGTKRVSEAFFPLLRKNAQIINISSAAGHITCIPDPDLREKFTMNITTEKLEIILNNFIAKLDYGKFNWKNIGYVLSKVAVCALTIAHQRFVNDKFPQRNIRINSVHPGYVATDMTSGKGIQLPEDGAKSSLFLALSANHEFKGEFIWYNCKRVEWLSEKTPKDIKQLGN